MSLAAWYLHKADQCARLAKDAIEPRKRSDFENERKLWLQIAEQIEMDEVRWFGTQSRCDAARLHSAALTTLQRSGRTASHPPRAEPQALRHPKLSAAPLLVRAGFSVAEPTASVPPVSRNSLGGRLVIFRE